MKVLALLVGPQLLLLMNAVWSEQSGNELLTVVYSPTLLGMAPFVAVTEKADGSLSLAIAESCQIKEMATGNAIQERTTRISGSMRQFGWTSGRSYYGV